MQHPPKKEIKRRKGRRWLIVLMLACLALAAAFVLLLPRLKALFPSQTTVIFTQTVKPHTFEITQAEAVDSVTVTPENGESYLLRMHDGVLWLDENGELTDINDAYADELLRAATQIVAQGVVAQDGAEVREQLHEMGLDEPRASALIRYTDGREATLEIGAAVPNTTYAYCRWSGSPAIYMCDSGVVDALTLTRSRLIPVTQPVIYAGLLDSLTLTNAGGTCELAFTDGAYGTMTSPYQYPLAADASARLLTAVENFRLGTREATVMDENRASYGFDDPLCVMELEQSAGVMSEIDDSGEFVTRLADAQTLRFTIGRAEGDYFYTCEYEGECYFVSRFLVDALVNTKANELLSRSPADVGDLAVRRIVVQTPRGGAEMLVTRTERVLPNNELEVDANGNVVYDTAVTLNGKTAAVEWKDELISRLDALTVSGNAPQGWQPEGAPRWSVIIETENGLVRTVEAYRLDLFTDVIRVDGAALHCVSSEAMDVIAEGLI